MTGTVLIVDDNPDDREALRRLLAASDAAPFSVREASDAASCMGLLDAGHAIDCVLLDYSLPGRDGLGVLRQIVDRDPTLAVVMVTGQGSEHIAVNAMKRGAQDYIKKERLTAEALHRAITNATERANMQRKINEQQESLRLFAHILVHDLRAPLRTITEAIDLLVDNLPKDVAVDNTDMIGFVVRAADRMDQLIQALKTYTSIDGDKPVFQTLDLNENLAAVRDSMASDLAAANATLDCPGHLPSIVGNAPQISQLLQNIIGNGIKYNTSGAPRIAVSAVDSAGCWRIEIADNGIGIPAQHLKRIFEPFKRLHGASEFSGTGLGLATCTKIAERHGARLACRSEPGRGTTFVFEIAKAQ